VADGGRAARQQGDVRYTAAEIAAAREKLGFQPRVKLYDGLVQEWDWVRSLSE
jgi:nucleoside-diphosphate-sugar epimerase